MKCYRVSKYNPIYRDANGVYHREEWTSYSDIGKIFNGEMFDIEQYCVVEQRYLSFVKDVLNIINPDTITVIKLENYSQTIWKNLLTISKNEFEFLVQDCLREKCWCEIVADFFVLSFGYEFYLYIQTALSENSINEIAALNHLFVENNMDWPWNNT